MKPENMALKGLPNPVLCPPVPGSIEASESEGQRQLNDGKIDSLPTECQDDALLREWGFVLGDRIPDNEIFRHAQLPEGWTMKATDHAMHSAICDDQGRERVSVFYKAAFYDRRASMYAEPRIDWVTDFMGNIFEDDSPRKVTITDRETGKTLVFEGPAKTVERDALAFCAALTGDQGKERYEMTWQGSEWWGKEISWKE